MKRRPVFRKRFKLASLGVLGVLGLILSLCGMGGFFYWQSRVWVDHLKKSYPVVQYSGPGKPFHVVLQNRMPTHWVRIGYVSLAAQHAVQISEDWGFFDHKGVDYHEIQDSLRRDLEERKFVRGGSTITQQVARNVFLGQDKTIGRKLREMCIAFELESKLNKKKILEIYLNIAEWGEGIFGIEKAAHHYFHKSSHNLDAKEGAFLAMLLPSPKRYGRSFLDKKLTPYAEDTVNSILEKMVIAHYLSEGERNQLLAQPLSFENESRN